MSLNKSFKFYFLRSRNDRYDSLRICVGEEIFQKLKNVQLFMVRESSNIYMRTSDLSKVFI